MCKRKKDILGMDPGTARNILIKSLLFNMAQKLDNIQCFRCGKIIDDVKDFSIDHKESWLLSINPKEKFFDLDNIAFSHLKCNVSCKTTFKKYNTEEERINAVRKQNRERMRKYYTTDKRRLKYQRTGY